MEKRYQVFVSSTYEDLRPERQEIMQALLELDCIPAGMELFPAADDDQWTLIKQVIDDCDYYIVVVAGRYGSEGPDGISYTRMEYEYAVEQGKPVIGFLHKNPGSIAADKTEKDPGQFAKLDEFRDLIKRKVVKYWETPQELGSVVSRSLVKLIKNNPAVGWVKADILPDKDTTEEILSLKRKIEDLEKELQESKSPSFVPLLELSRGDDTINISFTFMSQNPKNYSDRTHYKNECSVTWNEVFSNISPLMIDEANEFVLKRELDDFIERVNRETLEGHDSLKGYRLFEFDLDKQSFETLKIQFVALGLIKKSMRTRSVNDKSTYWSLTPKGEQLMMQLRAIKRPGVEASKPKSKPGDEEPKQEAK